MESRFTAIESRVRDMTYDFSALSEIIRIIRMIFIYCFLFVFLCCFVQLNALEAQNQQLQTQLLHTTKRK